MARKIHRLKGTAINTRKPGLYSDGGGLYLQVGDGAKRSWIFRFKADDGRERYMGLGSAITLSLADAREEARKCREIRLRGSDPIIEREAGRTALQAAQRALESFKDASERFMADHAASWKNPKHATQWRTTLETYAYPVLGSLPVHAITPDHVLEVIRPLWSTKPETANRLRGRIEAVWDASKARLRFPGDNPAAWRLLKALLPKRSKVKAVVHHVALPYGEAGAFVAALRGRSGVTAEALELIVLCASRLGEVAGMRECEVDLVARVWTVPGERMKGGLEHRVPLSDRAVEIIRKRLTGKPDALVFPGLTGRPLSDAAFKKLRMAVGFSTTTHGLRACFKTWASEQTNFPNEVSEAALAHKIPEAVERAYNRTTFFEKRRELMKAWADYCDRIAPPADNVVAIRSAV